MSLNIELPTERSLKLLAPQKKKDAIIEPMKMLSQSYFLTKTEKNSQIKKIPAGQNHANDSGRLKRYRRTNNKIDASAVSEF